MDRKKELKAEYLQMKPPMGIFMISSKSSNKTYIESTKNLKATMNSAKFKLGAGNHPNKELQKEWKEFGEAHFTMEILEELQYDEDESKVDYSEDLALLQMIWEERLAEQKMVFYKKKI